MKRLRLLPKNGKYAVKRWIPMFKTGEYTHRNNPRVPYTRYRSLNIYFLRHSLNIFLWRLKDGK